MWEDSDVTGVSEGLLSRGELPVRPLASYSPCLPAHPLPRGIESHLPRGAISLHPTPSSTAFWLKDRPVLASPETCSTSAAPLAPPHLFTHRPRSNPLLPTFILESALRRGNWRHLRIWGFLTQYLPVHSPQPQRFCGHGPRQASAALFCCSTGGLWGEDKELELACGSEIGRQTNLGMSGINQSLSLPPSLTI